MSVPKMYPEVGNLSPFQNGYPQYPMDSDFLQAFDETDGLIDSDLQGMIDPDLMMDDFAPDVAMADQAWASFDHNRAEPPANALASSSAGPIQQAIYSYQQQSAIPEGVDPNGPYTPATVSPSQLFQAPPRASKPLTDVPELNPRAELIVRKPANPIKLPNAASPQLGSTTKKPTPIKSTSQQPSASKAAGATNESRPSGFELIKKEYLNGDAKYGWHGRFAGASLTPLDKLMSEVAPQPSTSEIKKGATTDAEAFEMSPPKITLNAVQVSELCQTLYKGMPSAYSKAWKQHPGGLRFFRHYLERAVKGLEASPQGSWLQAAYKLLDLLAKVTPPMHEIGYYGLAPPISALVKGKDLEKNLRRYSKEVRAGLIAAQEALEAGGSTAQKRGSIEVEDENAKKKTKIESAKAVPTSKPTLNGKTVVKVAAKKNNNADMSAFGLASSAPKPKRLVSTSRPDAVTSLLSGLNPAALNSQTNSRSGQDSVPQASSSKLGKKKLGLRVRFKEGDELEMVKLIENRDDKAYESAGANTNQLEGEGKFMKEHADLEAQQEWYEPEPLTEIDSAFLKEESAVSDPVDQAAPSEVASGISTVDEASPDLVEYELDLSHLMETEDQHGAPIEASTEQNQAFAAPPSDLASLLSQLSKGSGSPATQGAASGTLQNGNPPMSAPAPIALDMDVLSKIVSSVNAAKAAPIYSPHSTYAQPNLPIQSHYPQGTVAPFSSYQQHSMMASLPPPQPQGNGWNRSAPSGYQQFNQQASYNDVRPKKCYDMINKGQCNKPHCRFEH